MKKLLLFISLLFLISCDHYEIKQCKHNNELLTWIEYIAVPNEQLTFEETMYSFEEPKCGFFCRIDTFYSDSLKQIRYKEAEKWINNHPISLF